MPSRGVGKGRADLALDERGRFIETYYLQVVYSRLNPEPNDTPGTALNDTAQRVLDDVVAFSHQWGLDYYQALMEHAQKK